MQNKNPCWPHCEDETPQKTCRATCKRWKIYEAEKFEEYKQRERKILEIMDLNEYTSDAIGRMKRGKKK